MDKPKWKKEIHGLYVKYYNANGKPLRLKHNLTVSVNRKGHQKVYLYPLFLELRAKHTSDDDIIKEFQKVCDRSDSYLRTKIRFYLNKKTSQI